MIKEALRAALLVGVVAGLTAAEPPERHQNTQAEPGKSKNTVSIELNRLENHDDSCRVFLVIHNAEPDFYTGFKLDLVVFDQSGMISQRLAVEMAPVRPHKTQVKLFDIPHLGCDKIGSLLVNDVLGCRTASGPVANCVARVTTSSRLKVSLTK